MASRLFLSFLPLGISLSEYGTSGLLGFCSATSCEDNTRVSQIISWNRSSQKCGKKTARGTSALGLPSERYSSLVSRHLGIHHLVIPGQPAQAAWQEQNQVGDMVSKTSPRLEYEYAPPTRRTACRPCVGTYCPSSSKCSSSAGSIVIIWTQYNQISVKQTGME